MNLETFLLLATSKVDVVTDINLLNGNCLHVLKILKDNSIDSIVTDPPYGLSFMGKKWDYDVPSVEMWSECFRVLKPGGHLLSFSSARTYHRMVVNVEDAGFEIRDQIMWVYGSGFPKSYNVGKKVKSYEGWGTALKPAHEPIVMARKPISENTVADNVMEHGTGAMNIDECRVELQDGESYTINTWDDNAKPFGGGAGNPFTGREETKGRWPANFIHDGSEEVLEGFPEDCGRYFYCPKANKKERNKGCENISNNHPTVKPIELMRYLCRLVTPKNGTVLDPFMGSGTTGIAAKLEGFSFVGIELDADYLEIAKARINEYEPESTLQDFVEEYTENTQEQGREETVMVRGEERKASEFDK